MKNPSNLGLITLLRMSSPDLSRPIYSPSNLPSNDLFANKERISFFGGIEGIVTTTKSEEGYLTICAGVINVVKLLDTPSLHD